MQEMLDAAQLLDTFLDELVFPDGENTKDNVYKDILVTVSEQSGSLMFGAGINNNAGLVTLSVPPAPRDLVIVEEPIGKPTSVLLPLLPAVGKP